MTHLKIPVKSKNSNESKKPSNGSSNGKESITSYQLSKMEECCPKRKGKPRWVKSKELLFA